MVQAHWYDRRCVSLSQHVGSDLFSVSNSVSVDGLLMHILTFSAHSDGSMFFKNPDQSSYYYSPTKGFSEYTFPLVPGQDAQSMTWKNEGSNIDEGAFLSRP